MKHNPTMICTCGTKMSRPNYMGGNGGDNTMWWCPNCGRIKYRDWNNVSRTKAPKQKFADMAEHCRKLLNWAEGMHLLWITQGERDQINWTVIDDAKQALSNVPTARFTNNQENNHG